MSHAVPKYFCPKWFGATGWTSDVRMVSSGNLVVNAFTAETQDQWPSYMVAHNDTTARNYTADYITQYIVSHIVRNH